MLTAPRKIMRRPDGKYFHRGVAAEAVCIQGGLAIAAAGYVRPARPGQGGDVQAKAADAATYRAVGVFIEGATGGAASGDVMVGVQAGCWNFKSAAGVDAVTIAHVGLPCYAVDDETVALTSAQGTRCLAGRICDVDVDGVWVEVDDGLGAAGHRLVTVPFAINQTDLLAGTAAELISPVEGVIVELFTIVQVAVTTGGTVTAKVGATDVDGLSCVVANGATKGTVVSDTPTAGHASAVVSRGERLQVVPEAAFDTAGAVSGFILIRY